MFAARRVIAAAVLITAFTFGREASAQSVRLEPKHKAGETNYVEQNIEVSQKIEGGQIPGGSMEILVNRLYGFNEKVEPTSDGGAKVAMTYDRAMQKIDGFISGEFDSDLPSDDESPMLAGPLKAMVGGTFTMELDKEGKVKNFSGMKEILDKVEEAAGANPMMMQQLRSELTDERGRSTYGEQMYLMYPNKEVSVGDSWPKTYHDTIPQLGKVTSHYNYKLDKVAEENGHKVAIVSFTSKTEKDPSGGAAAGGMFGAASKLDGSAKGTITYDVDKGEITKQVMNGQMNVEIGGPGNKPKKEDKADKDAGKTKTSKDEDEDDDDQPKPMTVKINLKQTVTVMSPSAREKQKVEATAKAKANQEKDQANSKAKKKKPVKKSDDDDD